MNDRRLVLVCVIIGVVVAPRLAVGGEDESVRVEPRENWAGVFGDSETVFSFRILSDKPLDGLATWSFAARGRTIARGEKPMEIDADGSTDITLSLQVPPVKEGVIFDAELTVRVSERGAAEPVAELVKTIWIFPDNPFYQRTTWLKKLNISLFDPGGKTLKVFDDFEIPYRYVRSASAADRIEEGLLVIGEGTSLDDHRVVKDVLAHLPARGVPVLCLAPQEGDFPWPGTAEGQPVPRIVTFRQKDVIRELDKRLDAQGWPPKGKLVVNGLAVKSYRGEVLIEVADSDDAWPWLETQYPDGASAIICGFPVVTRWTAGPTPRFLFVRLLERLTEDPNRTLP